MASVSKQALVNSIGESAPIAGPPDPTTGEPTTVETMTMGILLGKDTSGEQRLVFMLLADDYDALGRPGYGDAIDITLTTIPAE